MLTSLRKATMLATSVLLVLVLGGVAAWGQLSTARRVERTQQADRLRLEETLSGLTSQYLQFAFLEVQGVANSARWHLRADDAGDRAGLARAVRAAHLATYGATLATTEGVPLTSYAPHGLPSLLDPGLAPLRSALAAGRPGLSDVVHAGDLALVGFAVPVVDEGAPVALMIGWADVRTWPLQGYDTTIRLGTDAVPYVVDGAGTVTASSDLTTVGTRLRGIPEVATSGRTGVTTFAQDGRDVVVSYAPAQHGWTTITTQPAEAFSGGVRSRSQHSVLALVVLLTVVVLLLGWTGHSRQRALRRLAEERLHDPLTGLAQRRLFAYRFEAALARQRRSGQSLGVLYCDLDGFKGVNDAFGHNVGDQLLVAVAERLRSATREDDFVARLGGDEFVVVLEGTSPSEAAAVEARLRQAVDQPIALGGTVLHPRISVGGAVLRDSSRGGDLLVEADLAMYRAKKGDPGEHIVVLDALAPVAPAPRVADAMPYDVG